jgi:vancomycin permeability regulator SanA
VPKRPIAAVLAGLVIVYYLITLAQVWDASRADYVSPGGTGDIARAAIVLGAAQYNGEPSPVLRARLDQAARLYESGDVGLVVVTGGGQAEDVTTEAKTGYDYLRESSGIPDERLRLEVQGGSTYESLAASARFLRAEGVVEVVLVTDRYHAKRSTLIAEEVGLSPAVSLTPQPASFDRLAQEAAAVAVGRLISFRRLERL